MYLADVQHGSFSVRLTSVLHVATTVLAGYAQAYTDAPQFVAEGWSCLAHQSCSSKCVRLPANTCCAYLGDSLRARERCHRSCVRCVTHARGGGALKRPVGTTALNVSASTKGGRFVTQLHTTPRPT